MAYIQVEASVRTHTKFLKAGPAASWLWLCGMGYCQDGLTDGFIPDQALDYLGVKAAAAKKLADELVKVRLWERTDGGWQVHDYLKHNKSAEEIKRVRDERALGGLKGGRPRKKHVHLPDSPGVYFIRSNNNVKIGASGTLRTRVNFQTTPGMDLLHYVLYDTYQEAFAAEKRFHERFSHKKVDHDWYTCDDEMLAFIEGAGTEAETKPETFKGNVPKNPSHLISPPNISTTTTSHLNETLDVAFLNFQAAYPSHRRKGGHILEVAFVDQAHKAGGSAALMAALENHKSSEQWADPKHIPGMDTWLSEERWRQTLPAKSAIKQASKLDAWQPRAVRS
jgi:hypothetical protein